MLLDRYHPAYIILHLQSLRVTNSVSTIKGLCFPTPMLALYLRSSFPRLSHPSRLAFQSKPSTPFRAPFSQSHTRHLRLGPDIGKMSGPPYNKLTYYTFGTPNGLKPAIVLEELGLDYKAETIDITKNTQKEVRRFSTCWLVL